MRSQITTTGGQSLTAVNNQFYSNGVVVPNNPYVRASIQFENTEVYGVVNGKVIKLELEKEAYITIHGRYERIDLGPVEDFEYGINEDEE